MDNPAIAEGDHVHALRALATIKAVSRTAAGITASVERILAADASHTDDPIVVDVACGGGAEAKIDVFAAIDVGGVEAAQFFPECASQHDAGAGNGDYAAVAWREERPARAAWQGANVLRFTFEVDAYASVIDYVGGGVYLDVAHETGPRAVGAVSGEDGFKPSWCEDQVVVE
jgi:hypothetical protein